MNTHTRNLSLSNREEQILLLASRGMTDRQISAELGIRAGTINTHWSRIRLKLGAATRSEAVSILLSEKADVTKQVLENEKQGLLNELSQRMQVEQELRDSRRMLQTVLSNAPLILWSTDEAGEILTVEGKALAAVGIKPTSSIKQRIAAVKESVPEEAFEKALAGEEVTRLTEVNGVWLETRISPMLGPRKRVTGLIGVSTDVTDRWRTEKELLEKHELLLGIMKQSPMVFHIADIVRLQVAYMSPSVETVLGFSPKQILAKGTTVTDFLVHPDDRPDFYEFLRRMRKVADGEVGEIVSRIRTASGEYRPMLHRATVFKRDDTGEVEYILSVSQIVSDHVAG